MVTAVGWGVDDGCNRLGCDDRPDLTDPADVKSATRRMLLVDLANERNIEDSYAHRQDLAGPYDGDEKSVQLFLWHDLVAYERRVDGLAEVGYPAARCGA